MSRFKLADYAVSRAKLGDGACELTLFGPFANASRTITATEAKRGCSVYCGINVTVTLPSAWVDNAARVEVRTLPTVTVAQPVTVTDGTTTWVITEPSAVVIFLGDPSGSGAWIAVRSVALSPRRYVRVQGGTFTLLDKELEAADAYCPIDASSARTVTLPDFGKHRGRFVTVQRVTGTADVTVNDHNAATIATLGQFVLSATFLCTGAAWVKVAEVLDPYIALGAWYTSQSGNYSPAANLFRQISYIDIDEPSAAGSLTIPTLPVGTQIWVRAGTNVNGTRTVAIKNAGGTTRVTLNAANQKIGLFVYTPGDISGITPVGI